MGAFLQDYGLWIALGGVFIAMQWFGMGCCGGHRHRRDDDRPGPSAEGPAKPQGTAGPASKTNGSCH